MTEPSIRKPVGVLAICGIIFAWAVIVMQATGWVSAWWWPFQIVFYLVAGVVWIVPMGPILRWMERQR